MFSLNSPPARSLFVAVLSTYFVFGFFGNCGASSYAQPAASNVEKEVPCFDAPRQLEPREKLRRALGGGECHSYELTFPAGHFIQIVIEQNGIDVTLTIYSQHGNKLSKVDRPNGSGGRETISLIAPAQGPYQLKIRAFEAVSASSQYELTVGSPRPPRPEDALQIKGEQLVSEGESLRAKSPRAAIAKFHEAADVWRLIENDYEEAVAFYAAAFTCISLGDTQVAIDYLKRVLPVFVRLKDTSGQAMVKAGLGWSYLYLADLDNAFESFQEAMEIHRGAENVRGEGIALYGLGWVHAVRGEDQKALEKFTQSLQCRRKVMDRKGEALTLTGIAKIQSRLRRYDEALKNLSLALSILPKPAPGDEADILSNLGWAYRALNESEKAMSFFRAALAIRREVRDSIGEATTRYGMSMIHRANKRFAEAEIEIAEALNIIESLRIKGLNQQLRLSYFASVQEYYEFYIALLIEMDQLDRRAGHAAKALHVSERARARGLLDLLAEAKVDLRQGVDPAVLNREQLLGDKLNALAVRTRQINAEKNGADDSSDKKIRQLRNELETIKAEIRRLNSRYAAVTQVQPLTAAEIQEEILDPNTLLLQYVLSEPRSFLIAVTPDEITTYDLPPRRRIESVARRFYEALTIRNTLDSGLSVEDARRQAQEADALASDLGRELSRMLLAPVSSRLKKQRLVIVGSGALQFIPFASLPNPIGPTSRLQKPGVQARNGHASSNSIALIEDHEVVILPSATALSAIRKEASTRAMPANSVVVLADPVFDRSDSRLRVTSEVLKSHAEFARLISSRWEGEQILSLLRPSEGKLLVDFAANRSFAVSGELGTFRIVHFATHALVDFEHPALSGIVLSLVDENGKGQNGFLSLDDIFKLKLPADLVVLSGCRTALGKDYAGEGLVGLTRAFMYAGAPKVAVSLWQVTDKSTSELMVRFHRYMHGPKKLPAAAALRAAQLDLRKDPRWRSPYFWASFTLQGDWR